MGNTTLSRGAGFQLTCVPNPDVAAGPSGILCRVRDATVSL